MTALLSVGVSGVGPPSAARNSSSVASARTGPVSNARRFASRHELPEPATRHARRRPRRVTSPAGPSGRRSRRSGRGRRRCRARGSSDTQSPRYMRSSSCASRPSPSASTSSTWWTASSMISRVTSKRGVEPRVLEAVPQLDEGHELARHVAVLTPRADLVVVELGIRVPERGRLRVLVDVALPAVRGDRAERAAAVDQRDRATDPARELTRRVRRALDLGLAGIAAPTRAAPARARAARARSGASPMRNSVTSERRDQRADRGARQEPVGARDVQAAVLVGELRRARRRARSRRAARRSSTAPVAIDTVSSVSPEYDTANASVPRSDERRRAVLLQHRDRHRAARR